MASVHHWQLRHTAPRKRRDHVHKKVNVFDAIQSVRHASFCRGRHSPMDSLAAAWAAPIAAGEGAPRSGVASTSPGYAAFARALPRTRKIGRAKLAELELLSPPPAWAPCLSCEALILPQPQYWPQQRSANLAEH